jgi:uncharacterized protein YqeY
MRERIMSDIKTAMKAGEKERVATLRLVTAAIKSADIEAEMGGKTALGEPELIAVLTRMVKQRRDSITQFLAGNRKDLADKEQAEIAIIEAYLPRQLDEAATETAIKAAIAEAGAAGPKDMGKVMGVLKAKYAGQIDFGKASAAVKKALS